MAYGYFQHQSMTSTTQDHRPGKKSAVCSVLGPRKGQRLDLTTAERRASRGVGLGCRSENMLLDQIDGGPYLAHDSISMADEHCGGCRGVSNPSASNVTSGIESSRISRPGLT